MDDGSSSGRCRGYCAGGTVYVTVVRDGGGRDLRQRQLDDVTDDF